MLANGDRRCRDLWRTDVCTWKCSFSTDFGVVSRCSLGRDSTVPPCCYRLGSWDHHLMLRTGENVLGFFSCLPLRPGIDGSIASRTTIDLLSKHFESMKKKKSWFNLRCVHGGLLHSPSLSDNFRPRTRSFCLWHPMSHERNKYIPCPGEGPAASPHEISDNRWDQGDWFN